MLFGVFGMTLSAQSTLQFTSPCTDTLINTCATINDEVTLTATAMTNCTPDSTLTFVYEIDENNDGSIDLWDFADSYTGLFPVGEHRVRFTVTDKCNNTITCEYLFSLGDFEPPTPVCIPGLATLIIPSAGGLTIWAEDLGGYSFDNCTDSLNFHYSFSSDTLDISREFNCIDICDLSTGNAVPLEIWITDEAGNQDYCLIYVLPQDPNGVCGCIADLPQIVVNVFSETGCEIDLDYESCYNFDYCVLGGGFFSSYHPPASTFPPFSVMNQFGIDTISIQSNVDPKDGVTTFDKVLIAKHILGTQPFTSDVQKIAADVSEDGNTTTFDIVFMTQLILNIIPEFPSGKSLVTLPEYQIHNQSMFYWGALYDFIAIKKGDVNSSASIFPDPCLQGNAASETRNGTQIQFFTNDQFLEKGKKYSIPIFANNYKDILGGQFTLTFANEKINIEEVKTAGLTSLNNDGFNLKQGEGILLGSWARGDGEDLNAAQPLFALEITANENTRLQEVLEINSTRLKAEVYKELDRGIEFLDIQFDVLEKATEGVEVIPNPFTNFTNISFTNSAVGQVELNIFDLSGKRIFSQQKNMDKGFQKIRIEKSDLPSKGIYFYEIKTENKVYSGKIIQQ